MDRPVAPAASQRGTPRSRRTWPLPAISTAPWLAGCCARCSAMTASRAACARTMPGSSEAGSAPQWPASISRCWACCQSGSAAARQTECLRPVRAEAPRLRPRAPAASALARGRLTATQRQVVVERKLHQRPVERPVPAVATGAARSGGRRRAGVRCRARSMSPWRSMSNCSIAMRRAPAARQRTLQRLQPQRMTGRVVVHLAEQGDGAAAAAGTPRRDRGRPVRHSRRPARAARAPRHARPCGAAPMAGAGGSGTTRRAASASASGIAAA